MARDDSDLAQLRRRSGTPPKCRMVPWTARTIIDHHSRSSVLKETEPMRQGLNGWSRRRRVLVGTAPPPLPYWTWASRPGGPRSTAMSLLGRDRATPGRARSPSFGSSCRGGQSGQLSLRKRGGLPRRWARHRLQRRRFVGPSGGPDQHCQGPAENQVAKGAEDARSWLAVSSRRKPATFAKLLVDDLDGF